MKKHSKRIMSVALAMLLLLVLASCGTPAGNTSTTPPASEAPPTDAATPTPGGTEETTPPAPAEGVKLTYIIDRDTDKAGYTAVMQAFTAKTGIQFEEELRPGGAEGETILKTRLATGDAPDFLWFNSGSLMSTLNPEENFVDLTSKPYMSLLQDSFKQTVTVNGKLFGIPGTTSTAGGWLYNKKVYAELGLSVPKTWAELLSNCDKIKAAGKTAVIGSYKDSWTAQLILLADYYNVQAQVPTFAADFDSNKAKYATTPQAMRAFEKLAEVYEKDYLNKDYLATTYDLALEMLVNGDGVQYPMLTFALSNIFTTYGQEAVDNIGVFAQPSDAAAINGLTVWMPSGWFACKESANLDAVDQFFDFYLSPEGQAVLSGAARGDGPSVVIGAVLPDNAYAGVKEMMQYFDAGTTAPALEFITSVKGPNSPQICVEAGTGMKTPAESAAEYDKDVEKQAKQLGLAGW